MVQWTHTSCPGAGASTTLSYNHHHLHVYTMVEMNLQNKQRILTHRKNRFNYSGHDFLPGRAELYDIIYIIRIPK